MVLSLWSRTRPGMCSEWPIIYLHPQMELYTLWLPARMCNECHFHWRMASSYTLATSYRSSKHCCLKSKQPYSVSDGCRLFPILLIILVHNIRRVFIIFATMYKCLCTCVISQAIPFAERGRVWPSCNYRVVAEERNYWPLQFGNKMLTSAKHMT